MNREELQSKLDELTRSIDELCEQLGISKDMIPDVDNEDYDDDEYYDDEDFDDEDSDDVDFDDYEDEYYDDEEDDDEDYDDELEDACGVGIGLDLSKIFDPRYNKHILSEPDENGMVEISDELYDRLYGRYHSKEDMLSDIIREMEFYITGKYAGDEEVWAETRYLGINKETTRPCVDTIDELDPDEYDIYDIKEFEQCYWTNANDRYADFFDYRLADDTAMRRLIDKYYPELEW